MLRRTLSLLLGLSALAPLTAAAQPFEPTARLQLLVGRAELDPVRITSVTPLLHGMLPVGEYGLSLDWGYLQTMRTTELPTGEVSDQEGSFLNPTIGLHQMIEVGEQPVQIGVAVAPPIAKSGVLARAGFGAALGARGGWDSWMYSPKLFGLLLPAQTHWWLLEQHLLVLAEVTPFVMIPVKDGPKTRYGAQAATEAIVPLGPLEVGARLQAVWSESAEDGYFQAAVGPMATLKAGPLLLHAMLLYNLDEPWGPSFEDGNPWGLRLGLGLAI